MSNSTSLSHQHKPRRRLGRHLHSPRASAGPPDLAVVAKEAVTRFLLDESAGAPKGDAAATAGTVATVTRPQTSVIARREGTREVGLSSAAAEVAIPRTPSLPPSQSDPQAVALRAAAVSVATLERIELAAAQLEADIAAARIEQAELQAGAGMAAEQAVRAAEVAWTSARDANQASSQARESLRRISRYLAVTIVIVVFEVLFVVIFASSAH